MASLIPAPAEPNVGSPASRPYLPWFLRSLPCLLPSLLPATCLSPGALIQEVRASKRQYSLCSEFKL